MFYSLWYWVGRKEQEMKLKNISEEEFEVVGRRRVKLADGKSGWTGVYRAAYSIDRTVIGRGRNFIFVPQRYLEGAAGERRYSKMVTAEDIELRCTTVEDELRAAAALRHSATHCYYSELGDKENFRLLTEAEGE